MIYSRVKLPNKAFTKMEVDFSLQTFEIGNVDQCNMEGIIYILKSHILQQSRKMSKACKYNKNIHPPWRCTQNVLPLFPFSKFFRIFKLASNATCNKWALLFHIWCKVSTLHTSKTRLYMRGIYSIIIIVE